MRLPAEVRFSAELPKISVEFMVMVAPPIVVVPTYMFLHLRFEAPKSYVASVYGMMDEEIYPASTVGLEVACPKVVVPITYREP